MTVNCYIFDKTSGPNTEMGIEATLDSAKNKQNLVWINLLEPSQEEVYQISSALEFHPITTEDLLNSEVRPKVEEFDDHLFVVFKALNLNKGEEILDTINLNFLLFKNILLTVHLKPLMSINELLEEVKRRPDIIKKGTDFLFYSILDRVVDRYLPLLDEIADELDDVEKEIFETHGPDVTQKTFRLKTMVAQLRRRVAPQREILSNLSGRQHPLIHPKTQVYFRDVYDHIIRIHDALESYRDIIQGAMDSYMTQVSNRMNEVMKTLSIIATIMLPLGLLAGLFGTNFEILPGAKGPYGFWIFSAILVLLGISGMIYFKLKKWF